MISTRWMFAVCSLLSACATDASMDAPFTDHDEPSDSDPVADDGKADGVPATFDRNHVVDDAMLVGAEAMSADDVQAFLEHDPYGQRSWLADATIDGVPASQAIVDAATAQDIDPIALLVRMQVEASLVSKTLRPSEHLISQGLGCGCPDGGSCSASYKGLGPQLQCAAITFRKWYDASTDGSGEFRTHHSARTLDRQSVTPINDATASLYAYTPWVVSNKLVWNVFRKYAAHGHKLGILHDAGN